MHIMQVWVQLHGVEVARMKFRDPAFERRFQESQVIIVVGAILPL